MERTADTSMEEGFNLNMKGITSHKKKQIKEILDLLFSMFILGPLTVLFWRGTFNYLTITAFKSVTSLEERSLRACFLFFIGLSVKIFLDIIKHIVYYYKDILHPAIIFLVKMVVLYLDSLFGVFMWVGGFNILYSGPKLYWYSLVSILIVASTLLMKLNGFQCTGGAPLILALDTNDGVFAPKSYFSSQLDEGCAWVAADTVFSYAVIHVLVICSWWGLWELENNYILEEMEIVVKDVQAWDSLTISLLLVITVVYSNRYLKKHISEERPHRFESNMVAWMGFLSAVNYWRGFWSICDFYFFPDLPLNENLILSHVLGFLLSFLLGASRSLTMSSHRDHLVPRFHDCCYFDLRTETDGSDTEEASRPLLGEISTST